MYTLLRYYQHMLQRKNTQLAPIAISENQLKFAAMRTVRCRAEQFSTSPGTSHRAQGTYRDLRSGGARVDHNMDSRITAFTVPNSAL